MGFLRSSRSRRPLQGGFPPSLHPCSHNRPNFRRAFPGRCSGSPTKLFGDVSIFGSGLGWLSCLLREPPGAHRRVPLCLSLGSGPCGLGFGTLPTLRLAPRLDALGQRTDISFGRFMALPMGQEPLVCWGFAFHPRRRAQGFGSSLLSVPRSEGLGKRNSLRGRGE